MIEGAPKIPFGNGVDINGNFLPNRNRVSNADVIDIAEARERRGGVKTNITTKPGEVHDLTGKVISLDEQRRRYRGINSSPTEKNDREKETEIAVPVGKVLDLPNGESLSTVVAGAELDEVSAPKVAHHEGDHAAVDDGDTEMMTIIPRGNAKGTTIPGARSRYSFAKAALAPHVNGHSGTGHDLMVARFTGVDLTAAANDARSDLARTKHQSKALAGAVTIYGTLFKEQIKWVKRNADERKADNDNGVSPVTIFKNTGEVVVFKAPKKGKEVIIPRNELAEVALCTLIFLK